MHRSALAFALALTLTPGLAQAATCTIENGRYGQPSSAWQLQLKPVPHDAAANQTMAFTLHMPLSGADLTGSVFRPNGYGSALVIVEGPCASGDTETCQFIEDQTLYANTDAGIVMIDDDAGAAAPRQLLIPKLAATLWYSFYRGTEFVDGVDPVDVFTLDGCE